MPVRFRGVSEYASMYQWQPSFKSAQFEAQREQIAPEAGLRSDQLSMLVEPSFAKKKKVPHRRPEAAGCLSWWTDDFDEVETPSSQNSEIERGSKVLKVIAEEEEKENNKTLQKKIKRKIEAKEKKAVGKPIKEETENKVKTLPLVNKSTWEKDKQSEYIQKIREKNSLKSDDNKNALKTKQPRTPSNNASKQSPKFNHGVSPAKAKVKSPKKEGKTNVPLRYRPLHHRMLSAHQSEYQQMYRKHSRVIASSPLISALDVVHSSSPAIPPHRSPKMLCKSEYASKFKIQSPLSKSVPNFSSPPSPSLRLKVRDLPTSPYVQRRSPKKVESEYADKYPARRCASDVATRAVDEARHNKLNREGTAFDKDHVNQICSPTNKYWDMSSVSGSEATIQANGNGEVNVEETKQEKTVMEDRNDAEEVEDVEDVETVDKDSLDSRSAVVSDTLSQALPVARKLAWGENDDENATDRSSTAHSKSEFSDGFEGRLPTPQLKQFGGALRTHYDLTTPCVGGALLTSPSSSEKKKRQLQSPGLKAAYARRLSEEDEKPVKLSKTTASPIAPFCKKEKVETVIEKPVKLSHTLPSPGKTRKGEENAALDNTEGKPRMPSPTKTKISKKPEVPRFLQPTIRAPIQGALRSQEFQHCGNNTRPSFDFDKVARASSASIASADDLLQRSLQRQDFWKTK